MQKKKKKNKTGFYIICSVILAVGAIAVMPKVIDFLSEKMYEDKPSQPVDEDDWGPEIVKKTKEEGESKDGEL